MSKTSAKAGRIRELRPDVVRAPSVTALSVPGALLCASVERDETSGGWFAMIGGVRHVVTIDPSVHPTVVEGAIARGERMILERASHRSLVVLGALRTQPTPGIDRAERYLIEAGTIDLKAADQISLATHAAAIVLRALGEVETFADRIVTRAEGVHKLVGRLLRIN